MPKTRTHKLTGVIEVDGGDRSIWYGRRDEYPTQEAFVAALNGEYGDFAWRVRETWVKVCPYPGLQYGRDYDYWMDERDHAGGGAFQAWVAEFP